jgi:hypothetical protein
MEAVMTIPQMREKLYPYDGQVPIPKREKQHINRANWRAGKQMQKYFSAQKRTRPSVQLHEKTDPMAGGSHDIAHYTEEYWPKMEEFVHDAERRVSRNEAEHAICSS